MSSSFIHLHIHTEYSLIDGIVRIDDLVARAVALKMPAVAITDQSNLFATVKFYQAAINAGIKPIIGTEIYLANPQDIQQPFRLILLCQNYVGYQNLTRLISRSYIEGQEHGKPIIKKSWLEGRTEGLLALSAAVAGDIGQAILAGNGEAAEQAIQQWKQMFPERFYIELQRVGREHEEEYIQAVLPLASKYQLPVVATNNVRFMDSADFEAHEARVCIHDGYTLEDAQRPRLYTEQQYLRSSEEMQDLFADIPEALINSKVIAQRCNLLLKLGKPCLPNFPVPAGLTVEEYLTQTSRAGLEKRLKILFSKNIDKLPGELAHLAGEGEKQIKIDRLRQIYTSRLQTELDVINMMGFAGYFLIVADFIQWARDNAIPVGPGRGSGAGSLVAYSLQITDLDPLQYALLFERFLNPERVSMPDFDIDFCMEGRDRVIEYVAEKYGRESVSQIITFGSMAAKAVVRDVGRVLGYSYGFVDKIAKLIPFELGITLEKALKEDGLKQRYETEEDVRTLIDLALKLEGLARNAGKHAGGVVISPSLLTDFTPLYCEQGGSNLVTQFDKDDVEIVGLVKFDFLGLRTLTIIDWAVQAINEKRQQKGEELLDITQLPLDDVLTYDLLKACYTTAIFQLESRATKDVIKRLQPDCFENVIDLGALIRPGPQQSGMVDDFIACKHGLAPIRYPHPALEPILRPTYGVILYQEQVMQIAQVLAGYTLGGADLLRRAMGKKKPEEMANQRKIFVDGAEQRGVKPQLASEIFDLMEKFSGYGFNKSHSAAYALLSYQTAWLKAHYPAEFMSAVLSSDMDNTDKVVVFINDCREINLTILPPNVNQGKYKFTVNENQQIIYGLGAIKGVGEAAIENIIAAREAGNTFKNLFDFCKRIDLRKVNRRVLEALIKSGAMDELGPHRAALMATLTNAIQAAEQYARDQSAQQNDLFGGTISQEDHLSPRFTAINPWTEKQRLQAEKEALGLYLSGHPFSEYAMETERFTTARLADLKMINDQSVIVAGVVTNYRSIQTKRGDRIAFMVIDDATARFDVAVYADVYKEYHSLLVKDQILIIEGNISVDDFTGGYKITSSKLLTIEKAREVYSKGLYLNVTSKQLADNFIDKLKLILSEFRGGGCQVWVNYLREDAKVLLPLSGEWKVYPKDDLLQQLQSILPAQSIEINY